MRISDWSSDVCSSDLATGPRVAVVWDRITTPTGIDINMASPGVDGLGGAGHPGDYSAHWPSRIASALLISLISERFKYAGKTHGPTHTNHYGTGAVGLGRATCRERGCQSVEMSVGAV